MRWTCPKSSSAVRAALLVSACLLWGQLLRGQTNDQRPLSASAIAFDPAGNLYIADSKGHRVWEATLGGSLLVVAGTGVQGFAGDGGPATGAALNEPQGIAVGLDNTLYIADTGNQRIRAVQSGGVITTFAGTGAAGFGGDGGSPGLAQFRGPTGLAIDSANRLLVCDTGNQRVRRIASGTVTTVAGSGLQGFAGDGGPALAAVLDSPEGVAVDAAGQILIADTHNHRVRLVSSAGLITTAAGTGQPAFAGDGGQAIRAALFEPRGLAVAADGSLWVADTGNRRVRHIATSGIISTLVGSGVEGGAANGAPASTSNLASPRSLAVSRLGLPVIADAGGSMVAELFGGTTLYLPAAMFPGRTSSLAAPALVTATYGQGIAAATVSGQVGVPEGQLQLLDGTTILAAATLTSGAGNLALDALTAGTHALTLAYAGDGLNPATSQGLQVTVTPAEVTATATSATVAYGAPLPSLTGDLQGILPGDASQVAATFSVAAGALPAVGTYPIQAALTGSRAGNYLLHMAAGSGQFTVTRAGATAALTPASQAYAGLPLALTAVVGSTTQGQPSGSVQLLDGNTVIGTATLHAGSASMMYASPPLGSRQLTVQYLGDGNFTPVTSSPAPVTVAAMPDFAVETAGTQSASAGAGGSGSYTLVVAAQPGPFSGAVSFSVSGLPAGATASFSPPQVVPGVGSATVTLSVQLPAATSAAQQAGSGVVRWCCLGLCVATLGRMRRRGRCLHQRLALSVLTLCFLVPLHGCSARSVGEGIGGVVSQTYALQVTGTATNLAGTVVVHTVPLRLIVSQ